MLLYILAVGRFLHAVRVQINVVIVYFPDEIKRLRGSAANHPDEILDLHQIVHNLDVLRVRFVKADPCQDENQNPLAHLQALRAVFGAVVAGANFDRGVEFLN